MNESTMWNRSVQFNTGGSHPLTLTPVALPRVETHSASKRTLRKRTKQLNDIIHLSAGDNDEAYAAQTANIIKTADEVTREAIISKLNIKTTIPAEHVAAMKATQNIPWNLLEEVRRWLSTFNVQLSTKNKVREVAKEWVGMGLKCEYAPLLVKKKKKTEIKPVPWCYIYNLVGHIIARMNMLHEFVGITPIHSR